MPPGLCSDWPTIPSLATAIRFWLGQRPLGCSETGADFPINNYRPKRCCMRHAKGFRVPRTSSAARLVVDPRKGGTLEERRTQTHASGSKNGSVAPVYRLLVLDDSERPALPDSLSVANNIPFDLDDIITVEEVCIALHVRRQWIIRKARRLPFVKRLSRKKSICSKLLLRRWLASEPGLPGAV
jgi:hypothetical protein